MSKANWKHCLQPLHLALHPGIERLVGLLASLLIAFFVQEVLDLLERASSAAGGSSAPAQRSLRGFGRHGFA